METDDLDTPWFVIEEQDAQFPGITWHRICHPLKFGPVEVGALQSFQDYSHTHHQRHMTYPSTPLRACTEPAEVTSFMAATPVMYEALRELFNLLEYANRPGLCRDIITWLPMPLPAPNHLEK
jgi:hypothetical protein